jgi:hypothetical protein
MDFIEDNLWIIIYFLVFFIWWIFLGDNNPFGQRVSRSSKASQNNPNVLTDVTMSKSGATANQEDEDRKKIIKECLDKFAQAEYEIDTLLRSYIIERLCSCQDDADNTYGRIVTLCERIGDSLSVCYGQSVGQQYITLKKFCCAQLKRSLDGENVDNTVWIQHDEKIGSLLASNNNCLSKNFLENNRREHCNLLIRMLSAYLEKNNLAAMIAYDSLKTKTDSYVESVIRATLQCKA